MRLLLLASVALLLGVPGNRVQASCNAVPELPPGFQGAVGRIDRRFLIPGRDVVTVEPAPETARTKEDLVISIIFKLPQQPPRTFFIAGDNQCNTVAEPACFLKRPFCQQPPNCFTGREVGLDVKADDGPPRITFHFPDTGVAGPVTLVAVAARDTQGPQSDHAREKALKLAASEVAAELTTTTCAGLALPSVQPLALCIDQVKNVSTGAAVDPPLAALPPPNDYAELCVPDGSDPNTPCNGKAQHVVFALDNNGDLLLTIDWTNVLRPDGTGGYARRTVSASTAVDAVLKPAGRILVPSADFLSIESGTSGGATPTPVFIPTQLPHEQGFVGTADKGMSTLRFAQRKPWHQWCRGGRNDLEACSTDSDCQPSNLDPSPQCSQTTPAYFACVGGSRNRMPCTRTAHCPTPGRCRRVNDADNVCVAGDGTLTQVKCRRDGECGATCPTPSSGASGGHVCVKVDGTPTQVACTEDDDCGMCGPGLFEFRNRQTAHGSRIVKLQRLATNTPGVCENGSAAGAQCTKANPCSDGARCVQFRAYALPYPTPTPTR